MFHDLTKEQKRALRAAAELARVRDREMTAEDRDVIYGEARNAELPMIIGGAVARGVVAIEEVGEAARAIVQDMAGRMAAVLEDSSARAEPEEGEAFDPTAAVSLSAIVAEIETMGPDDAVYVNRKTGEIRVLSREIVSAIEDEADDFDFDDEEVEEARSVLSNGDWLRIIGPDDINDMEIMRRCARDAQPAASKELSAALSGRGAYRRFREVIRSRGLEDDWGEYRKGRLAGDIRFELEQNGVRFRK